MFEKGGVVERVKVDVDGIEETELDRIVIELGNRHSRVFNVLRQYVGREV